MRPVNTPRVATVGARPDALRKHIGTHVRKMYQSSVESNGRAFYVDVKRNEKTGEQEWHVWASNQWREAVCHCSELWERLEMLADVEDAPVDEEQPYGDMLPGRGVVKELTARTDASQKGKEWPRVDGYYCSSAGPKRVGDAAEEPPSKRATTPESYLDTWAPVPHAGFDTTQPNPFETLLGAVTLPYNPE